MGNILQNFEWYMIRVTGTIAYLLLYLTVIIGLWSQVQKKRKKKISRALSLHEKLADWALILVFGHLGFLFIDSYIGFKWTELLIPFDSSYKPIPMALGTISLYFLIITTITSKLRKKIGYLRWRKLHALNPILYVMVTIHGLFIGTDFKGSILAVVNLIPLFIIGVFIILMNQKEEIKPKAAGMTRVERYSRKT